MELMENSEFKQYLQSIDIFNMHALDHDKDFINVYLHQHYITITITNRWTGGSTGVLT